MDSREPLPPGVDIPEQISLGIDIAVATLTEIRATDFNDFKDDEFAQLESSNPLIGQFIQRAFAKLRGSIGEEEAYQTLTAMLVPHLILTVWAGQPLPKRL